MRKIPKSHAEYVITPLKFPTAIALSTTRAMMIGTASVTAELTRIATIASMTARPSSFISGISRFQAVARTLLSFSFSISVLAREYFIRYSKCVATREDSEDGLPRRRTVL